MLDKKTTKAQREPSHDSRFIWTAIIVFLVLLLIIGIAKFTALKTLFWFE